jgi:hypothetical protein
MFTCFSCLSLGRVNNSYGGPQYDNVMKGDLWGNDANPTSSTDIMTINVEHVVQKEDLYVNDTKECDNMYSNTELSEKISKYRIAVNDLALIVEMKKESTDFKDEFSVRIIYYSLTIFNQITKYFSDHLGPINLHLSLL